MVPSGTMKSNALRDREFRSVLAHWSLGTISQVSGISSNIFLNSFFFKKKMVTVFYSFVGSYLCMLLIMVDGNVI